MSPADVTIGLAFLAGIASFLSPCVLALVPAYVSYLGGASVAPSGEASSSRWSVVSHGFAFVLGFSLVFIALGAAASAIGGWLYDLRLWLARAGGVLIILFGLHTMGVVHLPLLDSDTRRLVRPDASLGYLGSLLMGVFFSAGWAPCVGPVLGAVLTLALNAADLHRGIVLLTAYSAGLAVPFLLTALGIARVTGLMRRHPRAVRVLSIVTGAVMVLVGFLLLTGTLGRLAQLGVFVDFGL